MASTEHLRAHHSLRSQQKREAVLSAARAMIRSGLTVEWVSLAARAGVSEKFIHDKKHADVKAQVKEMIAGQAGRQAERQAAEDQATIASLRAELLNLRAQLKRKDAQLAVLERKLSLRAGQELPRLPSDRRDRTVGWSERRARSVSSTFHCALTPSRSTSRESGSTVATELQRRTLGSNAGTGTSPNSGVSHGSRA